MRKMLPDRPPESMFAIEILDEKSFIQTETKHIHTQTFSPRDLVLDSPMRVTGQCGYVLQTAILLREDAIIETKKDQR